MTEQDINNLVSKWEAAMAANPDQSPITDSHQAIIDSYLAILPTLSAREQQRPWYVVFHARGERDEKRLRKIKNTEDLLRAWWHK